MHRHFTTCACIPIFGQCLNSPLFGRVASIFLSADFETSKSAMADVAEQVPAQQEQQQEKALEAAQPEQQGES